MGGINADANGVTAKPQECIDAVNVDITPASVDPRRGTILLGRPQPATIVVTGCSFINMNATYELIWPPYEAPGDFGFYWEFKFDRSPSDSFFIGMRGETAGRWAMYTKPDAGEPTDQYVLVTPVPIPALPPKAAGSWEDFGSGDPDPTLTLAYVGPQPLEDVIKYHSYVHPVSGAMLFAFTSEEVYRFDAALGWVGIATPSFPAGLNRWSVTSFIDNKLGATVVAAGSVYYSPLEPPVSESQRNLLFYNPASSAATGTFETLQMKNDVLTSEVLGNLPTIGPSGDIVTNVEVAVVSATPIILSSLVFVVAGFGVIATTGQLTEDVAGETVQNLIPTNDTQVIFGTNSWINLDTGEWSLDFTRATYSGESIEVYYSQSVNTNFSPIHVFNFHNSLVIGNTREPVNAVQTSFPWRIRWTPPNIMNAILHNDFVELALDDVSPILSLRSLETAASSTLLGPMYIYKHNSIIRGTYNQSYKIDVNFPVPLMSFEIAYSEGIEAVDTITSIGGLHYYLGRNDVYIFNGFERQSITLDSQTGNSRIRDLIFNNIDFANMEKCFGVYDEEKRRYLLYIKTAGFGVYPQHCFVYDIDRNLWWRYTTPETSTAISADIIAEGTIANLVGTIDSYPDSVKIQDLSGAQQKLVLFAMLMEGYYFSSVGGVDRQGVHDDEVDHYFISRDFYAETLQDDDRVQQLYVEGRGTSMEIGYNTDYSLEPTAFEQLDTVPFGSVYSIEKYLPDVITIKIRFIFRLFGTTRYRWMQMFSKRQEFEGE
jgi:hypothetical protein